jgi:plasmid stabilization system protein ParE
MARRRPTVIWSPEAQTDLSDIWDYYVKVAGRDRADTVARQIDDASRLIEDHHLLGVLATKYDRGSDLSPPVLTFFFTASVMTSLRSFGYCTVGVTWMRYSPLIRAIYDYRTLSQCATRTGSSSTTCRQQTC